MPRQRSKSSGCTPSAQPLPILLIHSSADEIQPDLIEPNSQFMVLDMQIENRCRVYRVRNRRFALPQCCSARTGRFFCRLPILMETLYPRPCTRPSIAATARSAWIRCRPAELRDRRNAPSCRSLRHLPHRSEKIEHDLLPPPRVFGHETAGIVAAVGAGVTRFVPATAWWRSTIFPAWSASTAGARIRAVRGV